MIEKRRLLRRSRTMWARLAGTALATLALAPTSLLAAQPGCGANSIPLVTIGSTPPCYPWQGSWLHQDVVVPSRIAAIGTYPGTLLTPDPATAGDGPFPAVVVLHGYQGQKHSMYWFGRYLASQGYVVLGVTAPSSGSNNRPPDYAEAVRSMIDFLESDANPGRSRTDLERVGAAGHSQGAKGVAGAQSVDDRIDAIVAFDNLPADVLVDDGSAIECGLAGTRYSNRLSLDALPVVPRVAALGLASDLPCVVDPADGNPEQKKSGYRIWRDAGLPAVLIAERNTHHFHFDQSVDDAIDFVFAGGDLDATEALFHRFAIQATAWFDRWLKGDGGALDSLLAAQVLGVDRGEMLSERYRSGAYLPESGIDCEDLRQCGALPAPGE